MSDKSFPRIVGVGASAGGLPAIEALLLSLGHSPGVAVVIVQHLSMDHTSNLAEILARNVAMPVAFLTEDTVPKVNEVYIRPSDQEVSLTNGKLRLTPRRQKNDSVYHPIDHFFKSLAADRGKSAIAVVLSGMGSDGSQGAQTVRNAGGLVMVQSLASAQFSGMPNAALRTGLADFTGSPTEIGRTLVTVARQEGSPLPDTPEDQSAQSVFQQQLTEILTLIRRELDIDFTGYRFSTIRRRIEKRLLIKQFTDLSEYVALLHEDAKELELLARSFFIGVTSFFRDPKVFSLLEDQLLPRITQQAVPGRPIRIWVPACSTGQEAYTIAMITDRYLRRFHPNLDFKILASDIDARAISFATEGVYPESVMADIPAEYQQEYFVGMYGGYQVLPRLRERTMFTVHDLLKDPPFIRIDLVSCRNFLIYVNPEVQASILANFHFSLVPDGYLILGPSESLGQMEGTFAALDPRWKVFSRKDGYVRPHQRTTPSVAAGRLERSTQTNHVSAALPQPFPHADVAATDEYAQLLAHKFAPAGIFVTADYDILYINGEMSPLLQMPRHHARMTLQKVLPPRVSSIVKAGVDDLMQTPRNNDLAQELSLETFTVQDVAYHTTLSEVMIRDATVRTVLVTFTPVSETTYTGSETVDVPATDLLKRRIHSLEERLMLSDQRARKLLQELESTNEQLQKSNRELLASNEEMQSTNEELQSVNEELHTVNREMQFKNDQLNILNHDINRLLESTQIGTLFLDADLIIRRFTPSVRRQFDLNASDLGRPISAFSSNFDNLDLAKTCRRVIQDHKRYEKEISDLAGRNYLLRILPHWEEDNTSTGLIVSFIDITEVTEARELLRETAAKYELLMNNLTDTIMAIDEQGHIVQFNRWEFTEEERIAGRHLVELFEHDAEQLRVYATMRQLLQAGGVRRETYRLRGEGRSGVYVEITFVRGATTPDGKQVHAATDDTILIIRDISDEVRDQLTNQQLLEDYREKMSTSTAQVGLIDTSGTVVHMVSSNQNNLNVANLIDRSVYDMLTESGRRKIERAFASIRQGSQYERVEYEAEDHMLPELAGQGITIDYEPVMTDGELTLFIFRNVS